MAKCQCGKVWLWNWEIECFVNENGKEYPKTELSGNGDNSLVIWTCNCGQINEAISNFCGECFGKQFKDIDWENEQHSYS